MGDTTKLALACASTAISAVGAISQGQAANQAARFEANQLRQQAERDRELARQKAADLRDAEARRRATLRALSAGGGTTLEGSPLAVLSDLASEAELQARRIVAAGDTAATRAEGSARLRAFEGRNARRAGFVRAGTTLLTAASRNFDRTGSDGTSPGQNQTKEK